MDWNDVVPKMQAHLELGASAESCLEEIWTARRDGLSADFVEVNVEIPGDYIQLLEETATKEIVLAVLKHKKRF